MHKFRFDYFSNGSLADRLREMVGVKKPDYASTKGWADWKRDYEKDHPTMYYITEILLNKVQNFLEFPKDIYKNIKYWASNKYKYKLHYLPTGLKPGQYYDVGYRLEAGIFETFASYVEIDLAYEYQAWNGKKYQRSREDGLAMLDYRIESESSLGENIQAYLDIREIYLYIRDCRNKQDDYIDPLYRYLLVKEEKYGKHIFVSTYFDTEEKQSYDFLSHKNDVITEANKKLETYMLMRIIELRPYLWA